MKNSIKVIVSCLLGLWGAFALAEGNRYDLTRLYQGEISAAKAFLDSHANYKKYRQKATVIDVRRVEEFVEGHIPGAFSIPFPYITGMPDKPFDDTDFIGYDISSDPDIAQTMENYGVLPMTQFVDYVESVIPDKDTYIITVCRTGYRSVQAANLLSKNGYTHVYNLWEGFVGQFKTDIDGVEVDLNNDGELTDADRDGWSNFQGLPIETSFRFWQIFAPYHSLYWK